MENRKIYSFLIQVLNLLLLFVLLTACVKNESPVAVAGSDVTIKSEANSELRLSGEASYDPSGDLISYHWTIESTPTGSQISSESYDDMEFVVTLDVPGEYKFALVVTDGNSSSHKDIVIVRYLIASEMDGSASESPFAQAPVELSHPIFGAENCSDCHNDPAKNSHIYVLGDGCVPCHSPGEGWDEISYIEHFLILGDCAECHELSPMHTPLEENQAQCENCHDYDISNEWREITTGTATHEHGSTGTNVLFDHTGIVDNCEYCHVGYRSTKTLNHMPTSFNCAACHTTEAWPIISVMDHQEVIGACIICHNNMITLGKPLLHLNTSDNCGSCHSVLNFLPVESMNHTEVEGVCINCHNGTLSVGKSPGHISSTDNCESCHTTTAWRAGIEINHTDVIGVCEACHLPPQSHVQNAVVKACDGCHAAAKEGWANPTQPLVKINN